MLRWSLPLMILSALPAMANEEVEGTETRALAATPDHFVLLAGQSLSFTAEDLLANDGVPGVPNLLVTEQPDFTELPSASEGVFTYAPPADVWGPDSFTYAITAAGQAAEAQATFHVLPERSPVAGHWWTDDGPGQAQASSFSPVGNGEELGWWNHGDLSLVLCDWDGDLVHACAAATPQNAAELFGSKPMMMDLDGAGNDELLLYDPRTGTLRIFEIVQTAPLPAPFSLQALPLVVAGEPGDLWFAGAWTSADDQLGRFRSEGGFWLEEGDGSRHLTLDGVAERPTPMAGDWMGWGLDQVAVFDGRLGALLFINPRAPAPGVFTFSTDYLVFTGPVFSGRLRHGFSESFLGTLEWEHGRFRLVSLTGDFRVGADGPLPIEVLIDPPSRL